MRLRKRPRFEPTNYREVSELVHERRAERARNSEMLRENPEDAEAAVRTYRPEQRLRTVDRETQQLVEDSSDIPRKWDPDIPRPTFSSVRRDYLIILGINAGFATATLALAWVEPNSPPLQFFAVITLFAAVLLIIGTLCYWSQLRILRWIGLGAGIAELTVVLLLLSQTGVKLADTSDHEAFLVMESSALTTGTTILRNTGIA